MGGDKGKKGGSGFWQALFLVVGAAVMATVALVVAAPVVGPLLYGSIVTTMVESTRDGHSFAPLDDGQLHVITVGTGVAAADTTRVQACILVIGGDNVVMIDAGSGAARALELQGHPIEALDAVLVTHPHADRVADIPTVGMQSWYWGRNHPLDVFGPPGTKAMMAAFAKAYAGDYAMRRRFRHDGKIRKGKRTLSANSVYGRGIDVVVDKKERKVVWKGKNGFVVSAFRVHHYDESGLQSFGYRIDYRGRVVVFSGDTSPMANVARHALGADILVHQAAPRALVPTVVRYADGHRGDTFLQAQKHLYEDFGANHSDARSAAKIAAKADVGMLVLSPVPPLGSTVVQWLFGDAMMRDGIPEVYDGPVVVAHDGQHLSLPPRR
ncbi:MAG: MBL fold metallo-hydrolase [Myxococcota bacterium]